MNEIMRIKWQIPWLFHTVAVCILAGQCRTVVLSQLPWDFLELGIAEDL